MAPIIALGIKLLFPVLVNEAQKKLAEKTFEADPKLVPLEEAAPVALKAAVGSIKSSKTMWFSIGLGILGVIEAHSPMLAPLLGQKWGWVLVAVGGATAVLRTITTTSLVDKE